MNDSRHIRTPDVLLLLLLVLNVLMRLPFIAMGAVPDEANYFEGVMAIAKNGLDPFVPFIGYKPPAMFMLPALLYRLAGPSIAWGRLLIYVLSSISLYGTYILGASLFSRPVGRAAAVLLFLYPPFITQSLLFQDPIPLMAATVLTVYFFFTGRAVWYAGMASMLVLTKEPGILVPAVLLPFAVSHGWKSRVRFPRTAVYAGIVPVAVLCTWLLMNRSVFGWFLYPVNTGEFTAAAMTERLGSGELIFYLESLFIRYGIWPVFAGILWMCITRGPKRLILSWPYAPLLAAWSVVALFHAFGPLSIRYVLWAYPLLFIAFTGMLYSAVPRAHFFRIVAVTGATLVATHAIHLMCIPANGENVDATLEVFRDIDVTRKTVRTLESHPGATVAASWPFSRFITDPTLGYVTTPMNVIGTDALCAVPAESYGSELHAIVSASGIPSDDVIIHYWSRSGCAPPHGVPALQTFYVRDDPTASTFHALYTVQYPL